jgi:hypothetical protein
MQRNGGSLGISIPTGNGCETLDFGIKGIRQATIMLVLYYLLYQTAVLLYAMNPQQQKSAGCVVTYQTAKKSLSPLTLWLDVNAMT